MGRYALSAALKTNAHYLAMAIIFALWASIPVSLASVLFYPFLILLTAILARAGLESSRLRRDAWLRQYLKEDSSLRVRLAVGLLSWLIIFPTAAFLSLVLLLNLRAGDWSLWIALLVGVTVFLLCRTWLIREIEKHVVERFVAPVARKVSIIPTSAVMILLSVVISLLMTHPDVEGMVWTELIELGAAQIQGEGVLPFLERVFLAVTLTEYWAMQNVIKSIGAPVLLNVFGWALFFLSQCAFVWAYCRMLVGIESLKAWILGVRHE